MTRRIDRSPESAAAEPRRDHLHVIAKDENAILYDNRTQVELYVDGVGQTSLGPSVCKIRFYKVVSLTAEGDKVFETRELSADVVVPTPALVQWFTQMAAQLPVFAPMLEQAAAQNTKSINDFIEGLKK